MIIATLLASVFLALGLVHVFWALGGRIGFAAALPTLPVSQTADAPANPMPNPTPARPVFTPSAASTLAVAAGLITVALMVALHAGLLGTSIAHGSLRWGIAALSAIMLARAIGDFRWVGFFKKVTGTPFARMDSWAYSPLCVALGFGLAAVAFA